MQASKNLKITEGSSKVSGALYMAGQEHLDLLLEAYGIYSHTNPLHTDVWPSMRQLESDVIAMTASMLGGQPSACFSYIFHFADHIILSPFFVTVLSLCHQSHDFVYAEIRLALVCHHGVIMASRLFHQNC